jgi:hypothetical protein
VNIIASGAKGYCTCLSIFPTLQQILIVRPIDDDPGSTKSEITAAQEHTFRKKALAAVEALMGMGPMQERKGRHCIDFEAKRPLVDS